MKNSPSYTSNYFGNISGGVINEDGVIILPSDGISFFRIYNLIVHADEQKNILVWIYNNSNNPYRLFSAKTQAYKSINLVNSDMASSIFQRKKDKYSVWHFDLPVGWSLKLSCHENDDPFNANIFISGERL